MAYPELEKLAVAIAKYDELYARTERASDIRQPGQRRVAGFHIERAGGVWYAGITDGSGGRVDAGNGHLKMYACPGDALLAAIARSSRRIGFIDRENEKKLCADKQ